jgi:hypothetical protein
MLKKQIIYSPQHSSSHENQHTDPNQTKKKTRYCCFCLAKNAARFCATASSILFFNKSCRASRDSCHSVTESFPTKPKIFCLRKEEEQKLPLIYHPCASPSLELCKTTAKQQHPHCRRQAQQQLKERPYEEKLFS